MAHEHGSVKKFNEPVPDMKFEIVKYKKKQFYVVLIVILCYRPKFPKGK